MTERDAERDLEFSGGFCRSLLRLGLPVIYPVANEAHRALNYWIDRAEKAEAELEAVMHSVDKWLEGDALKENPATRATLAREIALKWIEKLELERDRWKQRFLDALDEWKPDTQTVENLLAELDIPLRVCVWCRETEKDPSAWLKDESEMSACYDEGLGGHLCKDCEIEARNSEEVDRRFSKLTDEELEIKLREEQRGRSR